MKKYNWEEIVNLYKEGKSIPQIKKIIGASLSTIREILIKNNIPRRSKTITIKKLVPLKNSKVSKLISLPKSYITSIGLDPSKDLYYNQQPDENTKSILFTFDYEKKPNWNKTIKIKNSSTRLIYIKSSTLKSLHLEDISPLYGKWEIKDGKLFLQILTQTSQP